MERVAFILTRHVTSTVSQPYWIECIHQIRAYHPTNPIIIIDDGSNPELICDPPPEAQPCRVISSAFPKRGELLPYYYYYHEFLDAYDSCVILHDSVFLLRPLSISTEPVQFLWDFNSYIHEDIEAETKMLGKLNYADELLAIYHGRRWRGCFGVMSVIRGEFLKHIVNKYNWFVLMDDVQSRKDRSCIERVFAVMCANEYVRPLSTFGDILDPRWKFGYDYGPHGGRSFTEYLHFKASYALPAVKVWTGR